MFQNLLNRRGSSLAFILWPLLAIICGLVALHFIFGISVIHPQTSSHITGGDAGQHASGWFFFQQAEWQFPLGTIADYLHPVGSTVGYTDTFPWFAVLMKLLLPAQPMMQITGIWLALCFALSGLGGYRIVRILGGDALAGLTGAALASLAPPLIMRFSHFSLMAHWLILAAMIYVLSANSRVTSVTKGYLTAGVVLVGLSFSTHPYLGLMVLGLCTFAVLPMHWTRTQIVAAGIYVSSFIGAGLATLWVFGYFQDSGSSKIEGFGYYNASLFTFFNSQDRSALIAGYDYLAHRDGAYEGFAWIGPGGILLLATAAYLLWRNRSQTLFPPKIAAPGKRLAWCCLLLFVFALGSKIKVLGFTILTMERFYSLFGIVTDTFRSSGRFAWPLFYLLLVGSLAVISRSSWSFRVKGVFFVCVVVLQFVDQRPFFYKNINEKPRNWDLAHFENSFWQNEAAAYRHIALVPPQTHAPACYHHGVPRSYDYNYYLDFAWFAAKNSKTINSGYRSRIPLESYVLYCANLLQQLREDRPQPNTLYIIADSYFAFLNLRAAKNLECQIVGKDRVCFRRITL